MIICDWPYGLDAMFCRRVLQHSPVSFLPYGCLMYSLYFSVFIGLMTNVVLLSDKDYACGFIYVILESHASLQDSQGILHPVALPEFSGIEL